jgi:hypothetical protein
MRRRQLTLALASIGLFAAGILAAGQPVMYEFSGGGAGPIGDCGDFEVWEDVTFEVSGKEFYNKDGVLVKIKEDWFVEGVIFNVDDPDKYLPYQNSRYAQTAYFDEAGDAEIHATGLWALVVVPGYGSIFVDVGHIAFDPMGNRIFDAGQHNWFDGNVEEVCEFLR